MDLTSGSNTTLVTLEMTQPCFHLPQVCKKFCLPSVVDGRFSHRFITPPILYEPPIDFSFKNRMHARNTSDNWHPPFGIKIHLTIPPVEALHFLYAHLRVGWIFHPMVTSWNLPNDFQILKRNRRHLAPVSSPSASRLPWSSGPS